MNLKIDNLYEIYFIIFSVWIIFVPLEILSTFRSTMTIRIENITELIV